MTGRQPARMAGASSLPLLPTPGPLSSPPSATSPHHILLPHTNHLPIYCLPQDFLGLTDRVHDVSPYVSAPCGQALLECPGGSSRISPDFMQLRCGAWGEVLCG